MAKRSHIQPPPVRNASSRVERENMLAICVRNRDAFSRVSETLEPSHFSSYDTGLAIVWAATLALVKATKRNGGTSMPHKRLILGEVMNRISSRGASMLTDVEIAEVNAFLDSAFNPETFAPADVTNDPDLVDYAVTICGKMIAEVEQQKLVTAIAQDPNTVRIDLPDLLRKVAETVETAESVSAPLVDDAFHEGWDVRASLNIFATNIPFVDQFLGGGHAPGEVYGLLGPFGSCKSTIAYMLAVEGALGFYRQHVENPQQRRRISYIFSYEDPKTVMQLRSAGYAAMIPRSTLETMESISALATTPQDYEQRFPQVEGAEIACEQARIRNVTTILNRHLRLVDMTGAHSSGLGSGEFPEIARLIAADLRSNPDASCGLVIVDYVGAMVKRHMAAKNIPEEHLRHLINHAALRGKSMIGDAFGCPVWLLHQLNGEANDRGETFLANHTDAAECRTWAENLHFNFSIGKPNAEMIVLFGCTKHRRQPARTNTLLRVDGGFNRVECVDDRYCIDTTQRRIMLRSEREQVVTLHEPDPRGGDGQAPPPAGAGLRSVGSLPP